MTRLDLKPLPGLQLGGQRYERPPTASLHAKLVQAAVELEKDIAIVTPTLQTGYLDYHALAALFQNMGTLTPVYIVSPNTSIRDRYERMRGGLHYSRERWPLATVKHDSTLSYRTQHVYSSDAPPGVIFTRFSTRLPNDDVSREIRTVLYDDAVKYEDERWKRFRDWRDRNSVPSVVYFIRDPLGPVFQQVKDDVDAVWAWTPESLQKQKNRSSSRDEETTETVPQATGRDRQFIDQKISGQMYKVHACTEGDVVNAFSHLWSKFETLEKAAEDIDEKELYTAVGVAKRAINGFTRLLTSLEYSDSYRSEHGKATTLSGRIGQVEHIMDSFRGDAAAGRTPVEHVHHALSELRDTVVDSESQQWKRGAVLTAMQKVVDDDERLIILLPDEPAREALQADLRIRRSDFFSTARRHVSFETPASLPSTDVADHLLIYGALKYDHRWVLRTPNAEHVGILSYEHELGLLHAQVRRLNEEIRQSTPSHANSDSEEDILTAVSPPPSLPEDVTGAAPDLGPTESGPFDGITIDIPEKGEAGSATDTPFDDYELVEGRSADSVDDIIEGDVPDFDLGSETYTPPSSGEDLKPDRRTSRQSSQVDGCVEIRVSGGKAMTVKPTEPMEVVDANVGTTLEKPADQLQPGEVIVVVSDRDAIRESIEELLLDSGEIELVGYARMWKSQLKTEIERRDDSLDDFIERVEKEGLDKRRSTYRSWYYGDVHLPKAKQSLHAIASAYEMENVLEEFEKVWEANHRIRTIKRDFIELLKEETQEALSNDAEGDPVIDETLDIRLSDLDPEDESGNPFVEAHTVISVQDAGTVSRSVLNRWRDME